jgi:hypothetical protein
MRKYTFIDEETTSIDESKTRYNGGSLSLRRDVTATHIHNKMIVIVRLQRHF